MSGVADALASCAKPEWSGNEGSIFLDVASALTVGMTRCVFVFSKRSQLTGGGYGSATFSPSSLAFS